MGMLSNLFGGGTPAEKAQKLKKNATQKYGDPASRQKALQQLSELKHADAVPVLMQRFLFAVDPQTTDAEEKQHAFESICDLGDDAIPHVKDFLQKNDGASSWAVRIFTEVLEPNEALGAVTDELKRLGANYTRDPEKKEVLLHFLADKQDERVGPAAMPFLSDMSDDVKMAALKTLTAVKHAPAREEILKLLVEEETARRVQTACVQALFETGFEVQGFREKVEKRLPEGFFVDKSGVVKKRGA
ncbi:MAG: HEAT repeat domain-containing protein [Myxococcaceae bacterium]